MNLYCFSGLGADHRVFGRLQIPGAKLVPVPWLRPDWDDDMASYAARLSGQISEESPVLLGLSFGGMLATEIARRRPVKDVLLVSSAKCSGELPPPGRLLRFLARHRLIPVGLAALPNPVTPFVFGTETREERRLLFDILRHTDRHFAQWALKAMFHWQSGPPPDNCFHIHGRKDRLLPPGRIRADRWIEDGGHFMIYNRAEEIGRLLQSRQALFS